MNYSDIFLLVVAAIPILYRGWTGWRCGASVELRHSLTFFFATLVAIRFWQPCTEKLTDAVNFDPRGIAIGAFVVLFTIGAVVAGAVFNLKAQAFQNVQRNYLDNLLGLAAGLFSGALLGACVLWLSTIAMPGKFDSVSCAQSFLGFPREIFQSIETAVGVAPRSAGRTQYPEATLVDVPADPGSTTVQAPDGSVLMRRRGQIAWK